MLGVMAKKQNKPAATSDAEEQKRYPSRENTKYVALPINLYRALEQYAKDHSTEDDDKSISWAARVAVRKFLTEEGVKIPPPPKSDRAKPDGD